MGNRAIRGRIGKTDRGGLTEGLELMAPRLAERSFFSNGMPLQASKMIIFVYAFVFSKRSIR
jgi:hypothetical protein